MQYLPEGRENSCERAQARRIRVSSGTDNLRSWVPSKTLEQRPAGLLVSPTNELKILVSVVRFRPRPPRFTLQRSQPMRLASLFPTTNSPRVRSISGLLLFRKASPTSPPADAFSSVDVFVSRCFVPTRPAHRYTAIVFAVPVCRLCRNEPSAIRQYYARGTPSQMARSTWQRSWVKKTAVSSGIDNNGAGYSV